MTTHSSESVKRKSGKRASKVLERSAVPGVGPDRDDPPRFTREMAARGRHMAGDRVIRKTQVE